MANLDRLKTLTYEATGRVARITLNRPDRGNGIYEVQRRAAEAGFKQAVKERDEPFADPSFE